MTRKTKHQPCGAVVDFVESYEQTFEPVDKAKDEELEGKRRIRRREERQQSFRRNVVDCRWLLKAVNEREKGDA